MWEAYAPLILLLAGCFVGWNIGANDAANCIGTTVGAHIIPYRWALMLMCGFVLLGSVLQGQNVMHTIGKGIVIAEPEVYQQVNGKPPDAQMAEHFPQQRLPDKAIFIALLSAGFFVTLATFSSIPVSTSQAIVGGVAGAGLGIVGLNAAYFQVDVVLSIFGAWVFSPVLTLALSFGIYSLISRLLKNANPMVWSRVLATLAVLSSAYVSYSLGANDVGNAIGPLLARFPERGMELTWMGGIAMAVGAWTFGARVTDTVGKNITALDFGGALSAQFAAAFGVHVFTLAGIPVSTTQAIVGGVIGVGLTKGMRTASAKKIRTIVVGWVITPLSAALCSIVLYLVLP